MPKVDKITQNRFHLLFNRCVENLGKDYLEAWAEAMHEYSDVVLNSSNGSCYDWFVSDMVLRQVPREERERIMGMDWDSIRFDLDDLYGGADARYREITVPAGTDVDLDGLNAIVRDIQKPEDSESFVAILDCEDGSSIEVSVSDILAQVRERDHTASYSG